MRNRLAYIYLLLALCIGGIAQQDATPTSAPSQAVVPRLIRFTGQFNGATGTVGVTFTLHKNQQDNNSLWTETQNVNVDASGRYSVLLGATKAEGIPAELFISGEAHWLGIQGQGQQEQARVLLVSVPYALKAAEAETLSGHAATEFVTSDKLSSAVRQELHQQIGTTPKSGTKAGATPSVPVTDPATNFVDNTTNQVVGITQNGTGMGLFATSTTGTAVRANSTGGTAIFGYSTGVGTAALQGSSSDTTGKGIYGYATATSGINYGVLGSTTSPQGIGIYGYNNSTSGTPIGILGATAATTGTAIKAAANAATGANIGLLATSASAAGTSAVLLNSASGKLLSGLSGAAHTEVFSVDGLGNMAGNGVALPASTTTGGVLTIGGSTVVAAPSSQNDMFTGLYAGNLSTPGNYNTANGAYSLAQINNTSGNTSIGFGALNSSTGSSFDTALGFEAGFPTEVSGSGNTFIGQQANPTVDGLTGATAIGKNALVGQSSAIALGDPNDQSLAVGIGTPTPSSTLSFNGDRTATLGPNRGITGPGQDMTVHAGSAAVGQTDMSGGDLILAAGYSTGAARGGNLRDQTAPFSGSGATDNTLVDRRIIVSQGKVLTLSAPGFTSLMSIHLTGTNTAGGRIFYMVRATDGGSQIATEEGVIQYLATANSITCTVQTTDKLHLGTVNSGCTPGFFNPGSQPGVSIFDNVSFSSPAPIVVHEVYFTIDNESGSSIRLEP